ncbi:MAG: PAS domain S-box protein [Chloroflexi bacterium]|nr:PAS domain S-box protein [Chloroflexota bacterium]
MAKSNKNKSGNEVRERTEALLDQAPAALEAMPGEEIQALIRELHAQQVALSKENEALRNELNEISESTPSAPQTEAALRTLRENEQQFRKIFEGAQIGIAIVDVDETIQAVNPFLCRWLGYIEEDIQDLGIAGITHPEDWEKESKIIQSILQGKCKAGHLEKRYITKSGEIVWGDLVTTLIYDQQGNLLFSVATVVDITERVRAEEAKQASEEWLNRILESTNDLIVVQDTDGRYLYCNGSSYYGLEPEEVLGTTPDAWFPPDMAAQIMDRLHQVVADDEIATYETRIKWQGETNWFYNEMYPMYNDEGDLVAVGTISYKITQRKRAEEALRETEARFRRFAENAQDLIFRLKLPERTYSYISPAVERISGYPPKAFYDNPKLLSELIHPDSQAYFGEAWEDLMTREAPSTYEFKIIHKSGETRWVNQRNVLIHNNEGEIIALEGIVTDITQRKRAEEALRESQARLQAILDHTSALVYVKDLQGRFTLVNRALEEAFEIQPGDILGKTVDDLFPTDIAAAYKIHDQQALQFGRALQFEETATLADEEQHTFISVKFPIADADGEVYGLGGISTDITERTWMEEALRSAEREKEIILNTMTESFAYYNTDLEIQWVNQASAKLADVKPNRLVGRHCYEVWFQREEPCEGCPALKARETGEPQENIVTTKDGRVWNLRSYPIFRSYDAEEKIVGLVEFGADITERKEAEAALRRSQARYHSLFEDSPISLWEVDYSAVRAYLDDLRAAGVEDFDRYFERHPEATIRCVTMINLIDVNRATLNLYETQNQAEFFQKFEAIFIEGAYENFRKMLLAIAAGQTKFETQIVHQTLKGNIKHIIMKWHVLPGYETSYARVLVSLTDITQLKRAEEAVRRRNRDLAMLNQAARTFNATLEPERVFESVLGIVRDRLSVTASSIWLVTPPPSHTSRPIVAQRALVCHYLANPQDGNIQGWRVPWGQGIVGWVAEHNKSVLIPDTREDARHIKAVDEFTGMECRSLLAVPLSGPDGMLGVLELVNNAPQSFNEADLRIAESLAATASIAIRNAQLYDQTQRDADTKTLLLREVNHRVKNNLGAILGLLYVEERHAPPEALPAYTPILERLTRRVTSLAQIHKMLAATEWAPLRLSELAQSIIHQTASAMAHEVQVELEVSPSPICLPPNPAHHIALILNELTINTIEHAVAGRDAVRIELQITQKDEDIILTYLSDGPGYPPEVLESEGYNAGLDIIQRMITDTLQGELTLRNTSGGAVAEIRFQIDDTNIDS